MQKYLFILPILLLLIISLTGCASLGEIISDIPATDASAEIGAVETIAGGYLKEPYDTGITIAIGYALALLRRWYKKKQGAKNV